MSNEFTVWQICDSAFPAGAFAHCGGLEAAWQAGEVVGVEGLGRWIETALRQAAATSLPLLSAAWADPDSLESADKLCDSFLLNHVANRASRAQGQAFLLACDRTFELDAVARVAAAVRGGRLAGHWAPVFGAVTGVLGLSQSQACGAFLFLALRGAASGAVRLGIVGPLQAQKIQHRISGQLGGLVDRYRREPPETVAQTAPLAELLQGVQDRLYSRLFVS